MSSAAPVKGIQRALSGMIISPAQYLHCCRPLGGIRRKQSKVWKALHDDLRRGCRALAELPALGSWRVCSLLIIFSSTIDFLFSSPTPFT